MPIAVGVGIHKAYLRDVEGYFPFSWVVAEFTFTVSMYQFCPHGKHPPHRPSNPYTSAK